MAIRTKLFKHLLLLSVCSLGMVSWAQAAKPAVKKAAVVEDDVEMVDVTPAAPAVAYYGEAFPSMDRTIDMLSAHLLRKNTLSTLIAHRNWEGILKSPFADLLGFDGGGLKIILALRYGIFDNLDVGILRQNGTVEIYDTWEFDFRWRLVNQAAGAPFDFALRAGLDWYNAPDVNAAGTFLQALLTHRVAQRALLGGGLLYASNSTGPTKASTDARVSAGFNLQAEIRLSESVALDVEYTQSISGFHAAYPVISFGPKIVSNRHTFAFVISNTQYTTADSLLANTYRITPERWILGFNITRDIDL